VSRLRSRTRCPTRAQTASGGAVSTDIAVPEGHSGLAVVMAVLECLVKDHHGVLTTADIGPDGTGSFTVRILCAAHQAEEA
jgi:hypothetical protein